MWYTHHRKVNCRYTEETATSDGYDMDSGDIRFNLIYEGKFL